MKDTTDKILLITSDRIGDVIFFTPALALLRHYLPTAQIDALALSKGAYDVLQNNPAISQLILAPEAEACQMLTQGYDKIVALHDNSLMQSYVSKITQEVILPPYRPNQTHRAESALSYLQDCFFKDEAIPDTWSREYQLFPDHNNQQRAKKLLLAAGASLSEDEVLLGCHMGCFRMARHGKQFWKRSLKSEGSKSWDFKNFVSLHRQLTAELPGYKLVLTGTEGERKLLKNFSRKDKANIIEVFGKTSVLDLAAMMPHFRAFLSGDTGPLHVACAANTPLVALFFQTPPEVCGPYPVVAHRHLIHDEDEQAITVQRVQESLLPLLSFQTESV